MEETFGKRLNTLMFQKGIRQKALSEMVGVSTQQVWRWRKDKARPEQAQLNALTAVLRVSESWLLYGVEAGAKAAPALAPVPSATERRKDLPEFRYWNAPAAGRFEVQPYVTAAGASRECELAENPIFVDRPLKSYQQYFMIHGESMVDTLKDGDVVVVRDLGPSGVVLPPLTKQRARTPLPRMKQFVPDHSVCILSIDGGDITCKRIRYDGDNGNWHLIIMADNITTPGFPTVVKRDAEITFWAVVEGVALKANN